MVSTSRCAEPSRWSYFSVCDPSQEDINIRLRRIKAKFTAQLAHLTALEGDETYVERREAVINDLNNIMDDWRDALAERDRQHELRVSEIIECNDTVKDLKAELERSNSALAQETRISHDLHAKSIYLTEHQKVVGALRTWRNLALQNKFNNEQAKFENMRATMRRMRHQNELLVDELAFFYTIQSVAFYRAHNRRSNVSNTTTYLFDTSSDVHKNGHHRALVRFRHV